MSKRSVFTVGTESQFWYECAMSQFTPSNWPRKAVTVIVPYPADSYSDLIARTIGQCISQQIQQPMAIENRVGANGTFGTALAAKSPPDGYTVLFAGTEPLSIAPVLYPKLAYDVRRDFVPITHVSSGPNVLAVHSSLKAQSVQDLITLARARPGKLRYASDGLGSLQHMAATAFSTAAGIKLGHIPCQNSAAAFDAVMDGRAALLFGFVAEVISYVRVGQLRAIAVTSDIRNPMLPEVATLTETGLADCESTSWFAYLAPAGTAREIVERLNAEINRALQVPAVQRHVSMEGSVEIIGGTADHLSRLMVSECANWSSLNRSEVVGVRVSDN